jgi:uncharacterized BrkB/YihY/UPF0761 family membrane protein
VYYSCQILLLGAEFTRVYAAHRGTVVDPHLFAEQARRPQSADTAHRFDITAPTRAIT